MTPSKKQNNNKNRPRHVVPSPVSMHAGHGPIVSSSPDSFLKTTPSWCFRSCVFDKSFPWSPTNPKLQEMFVANVLPRLAQLESMTWNDIKNNVKHNHYLNPDGFSTKAKHELIDMELSPEEVFSLRIDGKKRLYGTIVGSTFHMLWFDANHGDNNNCVYPSRLKHT